MEFPVNHLNHWFEKLRDRSECWIYPIYMTKDIRSLFCSNPFNCSMTERAATVLMVLVLLDVGCFVECLPRLVLLSALLLTQFYSLVNTIDMCKYLQWKSSVIWLVQIFVVVVISYNAMDCSPKHSPCNVYVCSHPSDVVCSLFQIRQIELVKWNTNHTLSFISVIFKLTIVIVIWQYWFALQDYLYFDFLR